MATIEFEFSRENSAIWLDLLLDHLIMILVGCSYRDRLDHNLFFSCETHYGCIFVELSLLKIETIYITNCEITRD